MEKTETKAGTSINQQQAEALINEIKPDIERYWRSLVRKLDDLRTKYTGELLAYGILLTYLMVYDLSYYVLFVG